MTSGTLRYGILRSGAWPAANNVVVTDCVFRVLERQRGSHHLAIAVILDLRKISLTNSLTPVGVRRSSSSSRQLFQEMNNGQRCPKIMEYIGLLSEQDIGPIHRTFGCPKLSLVVTTHHKSTLKSGFTL